MAEQDVNASAASLLLVDDDPFILALLDALLGPGGHRLLPAENGEQALRLAREQHPDLILLDLHMPGMDGFEVCRQLKQDPVTAAIPVIFATAESASDLLSRAFAAGAADYLRKPIDPIELDVRVGNQLALLRARREQERQQRQADKLAQLGRLVGEMAHEIATPISNAKLSVDSLRQSHRSVERARDEHRLTQQSFREFLDSSREALEIAQHALDFAAQLLQSFRAVAVDQCADNRYRIRLREYLERILLSLRPRLKRTRISVEIDGPQTLEIETFPGALAQIISNLVNNALLHAFAEGAEGHIRIGYRECGDRLWLEFSDDGRGIAPEHQQHVFEAYFTTRVGSGGSGLGLHIVRALVEEQLGGRIELHSEVGAGTRFSLDLPLIAPLPATAA